MKKIKFLKNNFILLNGVLYTPYLVDALPSKFGFIYDQDNAVDGITQWFNRKGFTYIIKQ